MKKLTNLLSIRGCILFGFVFVTIWLSSCHKDNSTITSSYMSFKVNGTALNYSSGIGFLKPQGFDYNTYTETTGFLEFGLYAHSTINLYMGLTALPILNTKLFLLKDSTISYFISDNNGSPHEFYHFDTTKSYIIFTRRDSVITGTFECHGVNDTGGVINITNGQFAILPH